MTRLPVQPALRIAILALACGRAGAQPVGGEFRVNSYLPNTQQSPSVSMDDAGRFVVVWDSDTEDGSGPGVYGQRYDAAGAPHGPEFLVNSYTSFGQTEPSVALDRVTGAFVVVYSSVNQDGSVTGVFAQRYDSAGAAVGSDFRVNTYTTSSQTNPDVVTDAAGNLLVFWAQNPPGNAERGIFGQRFGSAGDPIGGEFRVNALTTHQLISPVAAAHADGSFVVAWASSTSVRAYARRFDSTGQPRGPQFLVNAGTTGFEQNPSVAAGPAGSFVIVWQSPNSDTFDPLGGIYGQRFDASEAPLGPVFHVNSVTTNVQATPRVAADSAGSFVVVWTNNHTTDVQGQKYRSSGEPLGGEFLVNATTLSNQDSPAVAANARGQHVVVWRSAVALGTLDVFGQRFQPIAPHGDVNGDGVVDVADVFALINFLFAAGAPPVGTADANGDFAVDVGDIFYLINFLFAAGPAPV